MGMNDYERNPAIKAIRATRKLVAVGAQEYATGREQTPAGYIAAVMAAYGEELIDVAGKLAAAMDAACTDMGEADPTKDADDMLVQLREILDTGIAKKREHFGSITAAIREAMQAAEADNKKEGDTNA